MRWFAGCRAARCSAGSLITSVCGRLAFALSDEPNHPVGQVAFLCGLWQGAELYWLEADAGCRWSRAAQAAISASTLVCAVLGIFQKLISSKSLDYKGITLFNNLFQTLPLTAL